MPQALNGSGTGEPADISSRRKGSHSNAAQTISTMAKQHWTKLKASPLRGLWLSHPFASLAAAAAMGCSPLPRLAIDAIRPCSLGGVSPCSRDESRLTTRMLKAPAKSAVTIERSSPATSRRPATASTPAEACTSPRTPAPGECHKPRRRPQDAGDAVAQSPPVLAEMVCEERPK